MQCINQPGGGGPLDQEFGLEKIATDTESDSSANDEVRNIPCIYSYF